jgi:hypothetical protein
MCALAYYIVHTTWFVRCALPSVLLSQLVSVRRTPPGLSETNIQYQKVARAQILAWCVSTCFYVASENMSSTNLPAPTWFRAVFSKTRRCHVHLAHPLPANVSNNAPTCSSFQHHLGHRNITHNHTKPWQIGLKASQTLTLRGSHCGELLFG